MIKNEHTEETFAVKSNCKYKELGKFPDLGEALEDFEQSYEVNKGGNGVADAYDVSSLVNSVLCEVSKSIPLKDEEKMSFIVDLIEEFLVHDYFDIDPLLRSFRRILQEHVKDQELIDACSYVLDFASTYTYEIY